MLGPLITKNDKRARTIIIALSVIVFAAVAFLGKSQTPLAISFDAHIFARINAVINSAVSVLLLAGLIAVKRKKYELHKRIMVTSIILSALFLVSYICHHLFSGDTKFGGQGPVRFFYFIILITHIILAATILPFILFTAYRALIAEWPTHRKLARITWPIWWYVSITGVIVYLMISPYYR